MARINEQLDINLHVYNHTNEVIINQLLKLAIENQINIKQIMADLTELTTKVEGNGTVIGSAVVLLQDLTARIIAAGTDPVKLKELTDSLSAQTQQLADAVVANTPADPLQKPPR